MLIEILGSRDRGVSSNLKAPFSPPPAEGAGAAPSGRSGAAVVVAGWLRGASPPGRLPPPGTRRHLAAAEPAGALRGPGLGKPGSRAGIPRESGTTAALLTNAVQPSLEHVQARHSSSGATCASASLVLPWKNLSPISQPIPPRPVTHCPCDKSLSRSLGVLRGPGWCLRCLQELQKGPFNCNSQALPGCHLPVNMGGNRIVLKYHGVLEEQRNTINSMNYNVSIKRFLFSSRKSHSIYGSQSNKVTLIIFSLMTTRSNSSISALTAKQKYPTLNKY